MPCAWLLSGALEVWSLRLRLRLRFMAGMESYSVQTIYVIVVNVLKHIQSSFQCRPYIASVGLQVEPAPTSLCRRWRRADQFWSAARRHFGRRRRAVGPKKLAAAGRRRWSKTLSSKFSDDFY